MPPHPIEKLTQKLTTSDQLKENQILRLISEYASELMKTDNIHIGLYDEARHSVHYPLAPKNEKPTHISDRKGFEERIEKIVCAREPVVFSPQKASQEHKQAGQEEYAADPPATWIGIPIMLTGKVLGVIVVCHPAKDDVFNTQDNLSILQTMANITAIALSNANLSDKLNQKTSELAEKTEKLNSATHKIAETQDVLSRTTLAADIVHRLNNLVGTIPIWTNSIKEKIETMTAAIQKDVNNMIRESVSEIRESQDTDIIYRLHNAVGTIPIWAGLLKKETDREADAILSDVDSLLREVERLKKPFQEKRIDMNLVLKAILNRFYIQYREEIKKGGLRIDKSGIHSDLHKIWGLYSSVSDAMLNIVSNGIESVLEASGSPGELIVTACNYKDKSGTEWIKIEIADTGKGLSDDVRERIFEPFFTTKKGLGRGYGLWRAKAVIENLGGNICATSHDGNGATFTVLLPKAKRS